SWPLSPCLQRTEACPWTFALASSGAPPCAPGRAAPGRRSIAGHYAALDEVLNVLGAVTDLAPDLHILQSVPASRPPDLQGATRDVQLFRCLRLSQQLRDGHA